MSLHHQGSHGTLSSKMSPEHERETPTAKASVRATTWLHHGKQGDCGLASYILLLLIKIGHGLKFDEEEKII